MEREGIQEMLRNPNLNFRRQKEKRMNPKSEILKGQEALEKTKSETSKNAQTPWYDGTRYVITIVINLKYHQDNTISCL